MKKIGLWRVQEKKLERVEESSVALEESIEEWIENDPSILQAGLTIVGRQLRVGGGIIDLLAVDPNSRWAVIEIKRGDLRRDTVAQALDYVSCIERFTAEELRSKIEPYLSKKNIKLDSLRDALDPKDRTITVFIVGTGRDPDLERMTAYLSKSGVPISVVTFDVFKLDDKTQLLAREITEIETAQSPSSRAPSITIQQVLDLAGGGGTKDVLEKCLAVTKELGIEARAWKTSIMFTPAQNKTRALFTVWARRQGENIKAWVSNEAFSQFFPLAEKAVRAHLGEDGWQQWSEQDLNKFLDNLKSLLSASRSS